MSGLVGKSDIDHVRESADLVAIVAEHVPLRPKGREHVGLCPFHDDRTPSLTVVTHKGNAFYKCHACGAAGDVFNFVMDYHKMSFGEALEFLADRAGITLHRQAGGPARSEGPDRGELRRANEVAVSIYREFLKADPAAEAARSMIRARGISEETAERFAIGAAPPRWESLQQSALRQGATRQALTEAGLLRTRSGDQGTYDTFRNRLIFPIYDEIGRTIALGGRRIDPDDEPKYLNSPDSPVFNKSQTLYGLHLAKRGIIDSRQAIVTEGYTDVVACHQAGLRNVVATLGTALTNDHARILMRLCDEVLLVFDGDEAGRRAADRAVELFFAGPVDVKICVLPGAQDPAELLAHGDGVERWHAALAGAEDALAYKVSRFRDEIAGATGLSRRQRGLEKLLADLARLGFEAMPGVRKRPVITRLADLLGVRIEDIEEALPGRPGRGSPASIPGVAAGASAAPESSLFGESDSVAPARRRAERELLGVVIYQPSLCAQPVATPDAPELTVRGLLKPQQFQDPAARRLAEVLAPMLDRGEEFTVQQLMGELEHPQLRSLAGALYLDAEQRLAHAESPVEHLREFCAAFDRLLKRKEYERDLDAYRQRTDGERRTEDLQNVLEQRRKQGYIPEAIPSRVRT